MHRKQGWSKRVQKERFRKRYLSRMQATRLLQTDSMGFRRLCILKGIYPRAIGRSKQKSSGNDKQYYLAREIKWLVHDQITNRQFAFNAFEKKVRSARAMHRFQDLAELEQSRKPQYSLDATIKERYPFFVDAVKDIDDAMSMLALYAFLSPEVKSDTTIEFHHALPTGLHEKAKAVVGDFMDYVAGGSLLSRAFISVKGYYYEAYVHGQRTLWLMPHEYAHKFPQGVQQYVLITFLEFYVELMRFILFKLRRDRKKEEEQRERDIEAGNAANTEDFDANTNAFILGETKKHRTERSATELQRSAVDKVSKIFDGFVFFCSREVPSKHVHFVVQACGGRVAKEFGPHVTHYVIDRPALLAPHVQQPNVEYVQPQYVFDCLNARTVLPVKGYRMGEDLPPHVSPFTVSITNDAADNAAIEDMKKAHPRAVNDYVPGRVHEIRKLLNPNYSITDPNQKLKDFDEGSEASETDAVGIIADSDDDVALSDDEMREANKTDAWVDEKVKEMPERSKLSAFKVKKQRELNLMNRPTSEGVAVERHRKAAELAKRKADEAPEARAKRKLRQQAAEERATTRMKLQVARKKAARYYKMVSSTVNKANKHADVLKSKADSLAKGKAQLSSDGKTFKPAAQQRLEKKVGKERADEMAKKRANPYKKLPNWVQ